MSQNAQPDIDQSASQLLEKLTSLRQAKADAQESERRQAFERAIDEELSGRPADTAKRVTLAVREQLIADARARDSRGAQAEAELARLQGQLEAVTAERDRAQRELQEAKAAAPAASAAAPVTSEALERVRGALFKSSGGGEGRPELDRAVRVRGEDVPPGPGAVEFRAGLRARGERAPAEPADRPRYGHAAAQGDEGRGPGTVPRLPGKQGRVGQGPASGTGKEKSFLIDLNQAYQASLFEGTSSMLGQLDPQPVAEAHRKPIIGVDYDKAWKALGRVQNDLSALSRTEMWERFYLETFRSKLSTYLS